MRSPVAPEDAEDDRHNILWPIYAGPVWLRSSVAPEGGGRPPGRPRIVYAINRSGFRQLLDEAAVGDTIRIADAARLFRSTKDVIQIREALQRRGLHLHIATGAWSGFDLAADDPQAKLFVTMLAGVLDVVGHEVVDACVVVMSSS